MWSFSFIFVSLLIAGIHTAPQDMNFGRPTTTEKSFSLGKLRVSEDGKTEELIPILETEQQKNKPTGSINSVQPLPSPCTGSRPMSKIAHPTEKTKYIQCRDQFHYEVFMCPNHGEFDEMARTCIAVAPVVNVCELEKPCLNGGECLVANSTFKCNCVNDWTGDRCETPIHICATKPCGVNGECRPVKASDYKQDYICVCKGRKEYGPNCLETVPNPCTPDSDQFFPFAFSPRLYIQCAGESFFFQPCGPSLFWNQDEKFCDRKRPSNMEKKAPGRKLNTKSTNPKVEITKETFVDNEQVEPTTFIPKTNVINENQFDNQKNKVPQESGFSFVPVQLNNQNSDARETTFAVNSQQTNSENFIPLKMNKVPISAPTTPIPNESPSMRFNQWQSVRNENSPVENKIRSGMSSMNLPNGRREGNFIDSSNPRAEIPLNEQNFNIKKFNANEESRFVQDFQTTPPTEIQNTMNSNMMMNDAPRTQEFQKVNQFPSQDFRTVGFAKARKFPSNTENFDIEKVPMTNSQDVQRISDVKPNRQTEIQFVTGFAPSTKVDRINFARKEEQIPPTRFSQGTNTNQIVEDNDARTFGVRVFNDKTKETQNANFPQMGQVEATTPVNRFSMNNEINVNKGFQNQPRGFRFNSQQDQSNEMQQFSDGDQQILTTPITPSVDKTFTQTGPLPQQRFPAQGLPDMQTTTKPLTAFRNQGFQTNVPLSWQELIRMNKPQTKPMNVENVDMEQNQAIINADSQQFPAAQPNFFESTTTQQIGLRSKGSPNTFQRDQNMMSNGETFPQQRLSQSNSALNKQFPESMNRQPTDEKFNNGPFKNQGNPIDDQTINRPSENSFPNRQRFDDDEPDFNRFDSTTRMSNVMFSNQAVNQPSTNTRPGSRNPDNRPNMGQFEGSRNPDNRPNMGQFEGSRNPDNRPNMDRFEETEDSDNRPTMIQFDVPRRSDSRPSMSQFEAAQSNDRFRTDSSRPGIPFSSRARA